MTNNRLRRLGQIVLATLPGPVASRLRAAKRSVLNRRNPADVFGRIYSSNAWDGTESVSGPGSTHEATAGIRAALPELIRTYHIKTLLDIPCGDVHWIGACLPKDVRYIGCDIVAELIERNKREKASLGEFNVCNLIEDTLPDADLALVRDCLIHLPNAMVSAALANVRRSSVVYLLTTTFPNVTENTDIEIGGFRPVNLTLPPFNLPPPLSLVTEYGPTDRHQKCSGLWRVRDLGPL